MKIKDIPKDKCGICPLIDLCGDAFEDPHLCFCSSIENMSVKEYIDMAEKTEYGEIRRKADEWGLVLGQNEELKTQESEDCEEENNCSNNFKLALFGVICDKKGLS